MTAAREVHLELLIGRKVRDPAGRVVGRLEEVVVDDREGSHFVREFHIGSYAILERLMGGAVGRSLLRLVGRRMGHGLAVPWEIMDLRDPRNLRITQPATSLRELDPHGPGRAAAM
jgi:sporulation protein YlmC with PRC-barrel domain